MLLLPGRLAYNRLRAKPGSLEVISGACLG